MLASGTKLRRALLAQEREIERLEEAVRALRGRHLELRAAVDKEWDIAARPGAAFDSSPPPHDAEPSRHHLRDASVSRAGASQGQAPRDARRFAQLLASEIVLYHAEQVEQGRRHRDLYTRLRVAIDRSRQIYGQRFGPSAAGTLDIFHDELVKALAGGDARLLGAAYPGPSK